MKVDLISQKCQQRHSEFIFKDRNVFKSTEFCHE